MSVSRKQRKTKMKVNQKTLTRAIVAALALVFIISFSAYYVRLLTYQKVYKGVSINGTNVSGMTDEDLRQLLPGMFDFSKVYDISIEVESATEKINTLSLSPSPDTEKMIASAMEYGRTKKGLARIGEIKDVKKNPVDIPYMLMFDEYELQKTLDRISNTLNITAVDNKLEIREDSLFITRGIPGRGLIYDDVKAAITKCILNGENKVSLSLSEINPEEITVDFIKRHTYEKPEDATYTIQDHKLLFTESHPGVTFKSSTVKRAIKNAKDMSEFSVPVKVTQPKVSTESLKESMLGDVLGKFSSDFSSSSNDRAHNIRLACSKINGYVLAPGEEFSYNEVVGPRTVEMGFKMANVYVGNTVQPGIGGGICQVSSTMFNAVVLANLEITERRNHSLPVSYVPMGRDATVSYGSIDFKFKNTYPTPIEISAVCEGRTNIITIRGKNDNPARTVEIVTERTGTTEPKVVRKEDPTLAEGTVKVEEAGSKGSTYVAYKLVYENGNLVSRDVLCKSVYRAKDRIEIVGTKQKEEEPSASPSPSASPTQSPKPSLAPTPIPTPSFAPTEDAA